MDVLEEKLEQTDKNISRILFYLENDDSTNQKGMVQRIFELQAQVDSLVTENKVFKAKAATWGTVGGVVFSVIVWAIKTLISKIII